MVKKYIFCFKACTSMFLSLFQTSTNVSQDMFHQGIPEGLDGGVRYSLFIKNLAHYSSH